MRFVDLSVTIRNELFEPGGPEISRMTHAEAARRRAADFDFLPSGYPDGMALAHERVSLSAHGGTHVDAPLHYGPLCEGKPSKSIEEVPLEWCYGPGVVIDCSHKKPAEFITKADLIAALDKIPAHAQARTISCCFAPMPPSISTIRSSPTCSPDCTRKAATGCSTRASA